MGEARPPDVPACGPFECHAQCADPLNRDCFYLPGLFRGTTYGLHRAAAPGISPGVSLHTRGAPARPPSAAAAMSDNKRRRLAAMGASGSSGEAEAAVGTHSVGSTFKVPGLLATDHVIRVPLDYSGKVPGEINVFVRELVSPGNARRALPAILYLQGKLQGLAYLSAAGSSSCMFACPAMCRHVATSTMPYSPGLACPVQGRA